VPDNIKMDLKEKMRIAFMLLSIRTVSGSCEHGNEHLGPTKWGICLLVECLLVSEEGPFYMELLNMYSTKKKMSVCT
jgi:hypothetical protein